MWLKEAFVPLVKTDDMPVAVLMSFMASCQRLKIGPWASLRDVLGRIATHPVTRLDELLPANWKPATT